MSRRFHTCGYPVDLDGSENLTHTWVHYGKTIDPERRAVASCPRCGELLTTATQQTPPHHPAIIVREWCRYWPELRHALNAAISARQQQNPTFYGYEVETILRDFEFLLRTVTDLAADLLTPIDAEVVSKSS
jgi:hypothetical protein